MLIQLRSIFRVLYQNKDNPSPLLHTVKAEDDISKNPFVYFRHPAAYRWLLPALDGRVRNVYIGTGAEQIEERMEFFHPVVKHIDFVRQHFYSVYEQIGFEFESGKRETRKDNLKDFMGKTDGKYKGSGSAIRNKLAEWFSDSEKIREFVIIQWLILDHYEYRPDVLRSCLVGIIDDAIEDLKNHSTYEENKQYTSLAQLRNVILELLSNGNDATALACMLLAAALGDQSGPVIWQFEKKMFSDCFQLNEDIELRRSKLSDEYYLTYYESLNYVGGRRKTDITLWKYPETMIEKINDRFGFFFYPIEIENPGKLGIVPSESGECVKYVSDIGPFEGGKALFRWMYQPDGRYFEDDDGFGAEKCEEIILYAYLNEKGRVVTPFSIDVSLSE